MNEERKYRSKSKKREPESKANFDQEQYEMLKRCSKKKYIGEWNEWRERQTDAQILLEDAPLQEAWLWDANLEGADLAGAHLKGAALGRANLKGARLSEANLEGAKLRFANLEGAELPGGNLKGADLRRANLEGAQLFQANLEGARLPGADLKGAELQEVNIVGANFQLAIVNGSTLIEPIVFDRFTDLTGVGLDNARVEPDTMQLLKYNIRRLKWERWYRGRGEKRWAIWLRELVTFPIRAFWLASDYGRSTGRIVLTFFGFAALFALVYYFVEGLVADLHVTGHSVTDFIRACYFSIVTMTTLGFGDMYANRGSWAGHILLILQVLLGYVLLAALVTRFAVLFTAGGPAGRFPKETKRNDGGQTGGDI